MFETNRTVILITSEGLEFVNKNGKAELGLGPDIFLFQELVDKTKLAIAVSHFISQSDAAGQQAVILLSDQLVYTKLIETKDINLAQKTYDDFIAEVPFNQENISKIKIYDKDKIIALAVNKEIYQSLVDILTQAKWEIKAVIPKSAYGLIGESVTSDQVDNIFSKTDSLKKFNFLNNVNVDIAVNPAVQSEQNPEGQNNKNSKYLYIALSAIIIILFALGYFFRDRFLPQVKSKVEIQPKEVVNEVIEASVSATPQVSRQDIVVQILNASGKAGEAGRIKDLLTGLGFTNISTSNYPKIINNTSVQFGGEIPDNIKKEVVSELNKSIASVSAETTTSATKNIGIIVGK